MKKYRARWKTEIRRNQRGPSHMANRFCRKTLATRRNPCRSGTWSCRAYPTRLSSGLPRFPTDRRLKAPISIGPGVMPRINSTHARRKSPKISREQRLKGVDQRTFDEHSLLPIAHSRDCESQTDPCQCWRSGSLTLPLRESQSVSVPGRG